MIGRVRSDTLRMSSGRLVYQCATNSKGCDVKKLNYDYPSQHKLSVSDWQVLGSKLSAKSSYWKHVVQVMMPAAGTDHQIVVVISWAVPGP